MSITRRPTRRSVPKIGRVTKTPASLLRSNDTTDSREKGTFFPLEAKPFLRNTSPNAKILNRQGAKNAKGGGLQKGTRGATLTLH
jgi:hypothetical protein